MRKILIAVLSLVLLLSGCSFESIDSKNNFSSRGIWISYYEINDMLKSSKGFANELGEVIKNCKEIGIEEAYIHVRSHCDSIFQSDYFPINDNSKIYDYDIFEYIIETLHKDSIKVHAWINPYRVNTATSDINELKPENPAYKWLNDGNTQNDTNVAIYNGIYLNPASKEVQSLIISGVKEIVEKYDVDGIVFDDYFYPTTDEIFDSISYTEYKQSTQKPLSLSDWRRTNVNMLISGCYNAIKSKNKELVFTVSPSHSAETNFNQYYADVEYWVKNGIVDVIMPQLYFGFEYPVEDIRFEKLLKEWKNLIKEKYGVSLKLSLGAYKIGTDSKNDSEEWNNSTDIIARQAEICYKDNRVDGFVIFSYSSLFSKEALNTKQRNNLKDTLENFKFTENIDG